MPNINYVYGFNDPQPRHRDNQNLHVMGFEILKNEN
jgi:hypothetical protein